MKVFFNLYFSLEKLWFMIPLKIRFLLVGGFNTVFAYVLLNILNYVLLFFIGLSKLNAANLALLLQYIVSINLSFLTMRYYVFQSRGNFYKEWLKACSVYFLMYLTNAPFLSFLIIKLGWNVWLAQSVYLVFSTIFIFLLHKYYSFKTI